MGEDRTQALPLQLFPELDRHDPEAYGLVERSLASTPLLQMGVPRPSRELSKRDPNILDFFANARGAPIGALEFDVMAWTITRWFAAGRPANGWLTSSRADIARALYGSSSGGRQHALIDGALQNLYEVSLDLSVLDADGDGGRWRARRQRRILQQLDITKREELEDGEATISLQLASWIIEQLDAHVVAAIAWQVVRDLTGISKRLAIYLAAHDQAFEAITGHTERLLISVDEDLFAHFGITARRERERRASLVKAAKRVDERDPRYRRVTVERAAAGWVLRADRSRGAEVLPVLGRR